MPSSSSADAASAPLHSTIFPSPLLLTLNDPSNFQILTISISPDGPPYTAFKIKCTDPTRYSVHPVMGYIARGSSAQLSIGLKGAWQAGDKFLIRTCACSDPSQSASAFWEGLKGKHDASHKQEVAVTSAEMVRGLLLKNASLKPEDRLTTQELDQLRALRSAVEPGEWEALERRQGVEGDALERAGDTEAALDKFIEQAVRSELRGDAAGQDEASQRVAGLLSREGRHELARAWLGKPDAGEAARREAQAQKESALSRLALLSPRGVALNSTVSPRTQARQREAALKHVQRLSTPSKHASNGGALDSPNPEPFFLLLCLPNAPNKPRKVRAAESLAAAMLLTVRQLKGLVPGLALGPDEDLCLLVAGNELADHWRGADFGLRATTRIDVKVVKKRSRPLPPLPVVTVDVETLSSPEQGRREASAVSPPPPPPPPVWDELAQLRKDKAFLQEQVAALSAQVARLEAELAGLRKPVRSPAPGTPPLPTAVPSCFGLSIVVSSPHGETLRVLAEREVLIEGRVDKVCVARPSLDKMANALGEELVDRTLEGGSSAVLVWGDRVDRLADLVCRRLFASVNATAAEAGQATGNLQRFVVIVSLGIGLEHGVMYETDRVEVASSVDFEKLLKQRQRQGPLVVTVEVHLPPAGDRPVSPRMLSFCGRCRFVELPSTTEWLETGQEPVGEALVKLLPRGHVALVLCLHQPEHACKLVDKARAMLKRWNEQEE